MQIASNNIAPTATKRGYDFDRTLSGLSKDDIGSFREAYRKHNKQDSSGTKNNGILANFDVFGYHRAREIWWNS